MQNDKREIFGGKNIVLGICSSIAVYKAAELASQLARADANVVAVMTANAQKLISPRIFQTLTRNKVYCSMWEQIDDWKPEHISLAESADLLLVAPATANTIGNFANALAPDMLSSLYLATAKPVLIAPAMNSQMYANKGVQRNIERLKSDGAFFVEPDEGRLACGTVGKGRLAETDKIIEAAAEILKGELA